MARAIDINIHQDIYFYKYVPPFRFTSLCISWHDICHAKKSKQLKKNAHNKSSFCSVITGFETVVVSFQLFQIDRTSSTKFLANSNPGTTTTTMTTMIMLRSSIVMIESRIMKMKMNMMIRDKC